MPGGGSPPERWEPANDVGAEGVGSRHSVWRSAAGEMRSCGGTDGRAPEGWAVEERTGVGTQQEAWQHDFRAGRQQD